jgi:diaminopimelate decarboxylase/aspartate kinase
MSDRWVVLKFGGTSVARAGGWGIICRRARQLGPDHRVLLVISALSQVSNRLEAAIDEALRGDEAESVHWIRDTHERLAGEIGLEHASLDAIHELLDELNRLLDGIRLTREASPRLRARVLSFGELASTRLGLEIMAASGIPAHRVDARDLMRSDPRPRDQEETRYLDASVRPRRAPEKIDEWVGDARVVITQGFIARTPRGETCLLGRGGSDTSAALFAHLLDAERLEIWTDVHGMFSADPRQVPGARLIRRIGYREAQELAAMGAKVLHPRCLGPVARAGIPLQLRNTEDPDRDGTLISSLEDGDPAVMAVVCRRGVTLLNIETLAMWEASGFLARVFAPFEEAGISVDLVATSQSAVSVTLDRIPQGVDGEPFAALLDRLEKMGRVKVVHPCAVVSIVGRRIRTVLHELGPAMTVFREHEVHLVSESSEDLNLSFVVDEDDADPLVANLHGRLFSSDSPASEDAGFGPTWETLSGLPTERSEPTARPADERATDWWRDERETLLELLTDARPLYVYHLPSVEARAKALRSHLHSVGGFYYSMKANPHPRVLETVVREGFGIECVSAAEVRRGDH